MRGYLSPSTVVRLLGHRWDAGIVSLLDRHDPEQPLAGSSPVLPEPCRVDLDVPFASDLFDELFAARLAPVEVDVLAERLGLAGAQLVGFRRMFTEQPPSPYELNLTGDVRMRLFGHASVLLDFGGFTIMTDPVVGCDGDGFDPHYSIADLPETIDVVVLGRSQSDPFSLETLLQLRRRIGVIVVGRASGHGLTEVSMRNMLEHNGFTGVVELADLQTIEIGPARITAVPVLGKDGGVDTGTMMVPLVRLGGRVFMFATDAAPLTKEADDFVSADIDQVDVMFKRREYTDAATSLLYSTAERFWPVRDEAE